MDDIIYEQCLSTITQLFGKTFWKNTIIEITFWSHDKRSKKLRKRLKKDEDAVRRNWDTVLRKGANRNLYGNKNKSANIAYIKLFEQFAICSTWIQGGNGC